MFWNAMLLALREIRRNVLRSSLTILGIVIGVAAVITMVTIGQGATAQVQADIQKLGTNLLQVFRGQGFGGGGGARSSAPPFTMEDVRAIENDISGVRAVAPASNTGAQAIYGNANWSTQVTGTSDKYLEVRDWPLASGRNFSESELRAGAAVCLLGATVKQELFGDQDPIGLSIRLGKLSCQVIGLLSVKGQSGFGQNQDDIVVVPLRTLQRRMAGNSDVNNIMVSARDGVSTEKVQADLERLLRERRKIRDGAEDDFNVRDLKEVTSAFTN
jgi:putative ABC transport system permease protein